MQMFRHRMKSDEVVYQEDLQLGQIVWVDGTDGAREAYVCTDGGKCVLLRDYREAKSLKAESRSKSLHPWNYMPRRPQPGDGHSIY